MPLMYCDTLIFKDCVRFLVKEQLTDAQVRAQEPRKRRRLQNKAAECVFHLCTIQAAANKAATHEFLISRHNSRVACFSGERNI